MARFFEFLTALLDYEAKANTDHNHHGNPVEDRDSAIPGKDPRTDDKIQSAATLAKTIDDVALLIETQLVEDNEHAESSRRDLERTLEAIRLKQRSIDEKLQFAEYT